MSPATIDMVREALGALQHMGFKPTRARALVDEVLRAGAPESAAVPAFSRGRQTEPAWGTHRYCPTISDRHASFILGRCFL